MKLTQNLQNDNIFRREQEMGIVKMANDLGDLALTLRLKDTTTGRTRSFLFGLRGREGSSRLHHEMISPDGQTDGLERDGRGTRTGRQTAVSLGGRFQDEQR